MLGPTLQVVRKVGAGAYGVVYLAEDTVRGDQFAVKCVLKPKNGASHRTKVRPEEVEAALVAAAGQHGLLDVAPMDLDELSRYDGKCALLREIATQLRVHTHPNVVLIHQVLDLAAAVFIVMDYYPDGDLFSTVVDKRRYANDSVLIKHVFVQLCDALAYCHLRLVFHCDIKPENILVSNNGTHVALADFGLAQTTPVVDGTLGCGLLYYMAPERVARVFCPRGVPTAAGDVWLLTVILINLTCTQNPWMQALATDSTYQAYVLKHSVLRQILPVLASFNHLLDRGFDPDPYTRATLHELRQRVVECSAFQSSGPLLMCLPYPTPDPLPCQLPSLRPFDTCAVPQDHTKGAGWAAPSELVLDTHVGRKHHAHHSVSHLVLGFSH